MMPLNPRLHDLTLSGIRRFTNLAKQVPDCVMLTIGEPDSDTPQEIKAAALTALFQNRTHYAPNQGVDALQQEIALWETYRGMPCTPEQVLITSGATGAIYTALTSVLAAGDEVIIPTPAFSLYETVVLAAGAVPVRLDIAKTGFQIRETALRQCLSDKTRAIVLNSPHNPTGTVLSQDSLRIVRDAVLGKPIWVLCDNVYSRLSPNCPDLSTDPALKDQLFLCQSFSKPYAMTGWRVGYLIGPEAVMPRLLLLHAAQNACVCTFAQDACIAALSVSVQPMQEIYSRRRALVCRRLREMGLSFPEPEGAFYVFVDISRFSLSSEDFCTRMIREAGVAAVPGSCFGCEGYIRISCCCDDARLMEGMNRMQTFVEGLSAGEKS